MGRPDEIYCAPLGSKTNLYIVASGVAASVQDGKYFRGTAISEEQRFIAFGIDGWASAATAKGGYSSGCSGEYCAASWSGTGLDIDCDLFGNARLLVTSGSGYAVAGDSVATIAAIRKALGGGLTANSGSLIARAVRHSSSSQQMSPATMFNEIEYVPAGFGLTITPDASVERRGKPLTERYAAEDRLDYVDSIRGLAQQLAGTVAGFASVAGWSTALSLSGGYDSRAVYSAARALGLPSSIRFESMNSAAVHADDHRAAKALTDRLGMVEAQRADRRIDGHEMSMWAATLLDVYDGFGPAGQGAVRRKTFRMTGIGAALLKGGWDWRTWDQLSAGLEPGPLREAHLSAGRSGLEPLGMSVDGDASAEHHYATYRNGLHSSAGHIGLHMTGVHPLQQLAFAKLGFARSDDPASRTRNTVLDLSILLDLDSACAPYDDFRRNVSETVACARSRQLGGSLGADQIEAYEVFGDPSLVPAGPSGIALAVARSLGASGDLTERSVLDMAGRGIDALPSVAHETYIDLIANARWKIAKVDGQVRAAGASSARVASLAALQLL